MANQPSVYNLIWSARVVSKKPIPAPVTRHSVSTLSEQKGIDAVILYPALTTPEILASDNDNLEILLLTKASYAIPLMRDFVRSQLKVSNGLQALRPCTTRALFIDSSGRAVGTPAEQTIDVESKPFGADEKLSTKSGHFAGYLDKRAYDVFSKAGYTHLYSVSMSNKCLQPAADSPDANSAREPQDLLIEQVLKKFDADSELQYQGRYYAFNVSGNDADFTRYDTDRPIQAWHPVYRYANNTLKYANISHISDVHLAARQQVLNRSRARIIDYEFQGAEADIDISPTIGSTINICSRDMWDIMGQFGSSDGDLLLIGGDLCDFIRSCHLSSTVAPRVASGKPSRIWENVNVGDNYTNTYKDCVDFMAFYGMLLRFCSTYAKPAYLISGNHDCYWLPYGLSPRIGGSTIDHRANEGIPSDHNLTFYEAILVFGETFRKLKSGLQSPFEAEKFEWFYTVFTPFTDFSIELPKQMLVGCGWGDNENLFDAPGTGHGFGHLPRSKDAISDHQSNLIDAASAKHKRFILMTHFTFASYTDSIPISQGESHPGDVYFSIIKDYEDHNLGTFEKKRTAMLENHCGNSRDIQVILTGHSHRRALYLVDRVDYSGRNSLKILHFDFSRFPYVKSTYGPQLKLEPAIIVSDSGGTIPRYNFDGEFRGRGSDPPSGTLILFDDSTGAVSSIRAVRTQYCRPRLAVALDYLDIQEKNHKVFDNNVITKFESREFRIKEESNGDLAEIIFGIELSGEVSRFGIFVSEMSMYTKSSQDDWMKIKLGNRGSGLFAISGKWDVATFSNHFATNQERGNFIAIKFGNDGRFRRYNLNDPWCFEFQVDFSTSRGGGFHWSPTHKKYKIERDKSRAEIPDFDWRRKCTPLKYGS